MAQERFTRQQFEAELEALGEEKVAENIATMAYGDKGDKRRLADDWLSRKRQSRLEASMSEQSATARSAKNAAWMAAIAAIIAAIASIVSISISLLKG